MWSIGSEYGEGTNQVKPFKRESPQGSGGKWLQVPEERAPGQSGCVGRRYCKRKPQIRSERRMVDDESKLLAGLEPFGPLDWAPKWLRADRDWIFGAKVFSLSGPAVHMSVAFALCVAKVDVHTVQALWIDPLHFALIW